MNRVVIMIVRYAAVIVAAVIATVPDKTVGQELIDVGGRKMEIFRAGQGNPTVVFELASPGPRMWSNIQPRIAEFTSTLSYYHFGTGRSDPAPNDRSALQIAAELRALLKQAGVKPPYVLVGHSMGGIYARVYAITYPSEVAGLVLVDPSHERQVIEFTRLNPIEFPRRRKLALDSLGPAARAEMDALSPILTSSGSLEQFGKVPDVPMVVLTSLQSTASLAPGSVKLWRDLHAELFQSTTYGMHIVTQKSGHHIQTDEPELVINAIRWVVEAARTRK